MKRVLFGLVVLLCNWSPLTALGYTYTWNGSAGTDWGTSGNWNHPIGTPATPLITDDVEIGTIGFTAQPTVTTSTATCASITFGTAKAITFTINGTLNVNGTILQKHDNGTSITTLITGSGSITCKGLTVGDNAVPLIVGTRQFLTTVNTNVSRLIINGNLTVISVQAPLLGILGILGDLINNAAFNVTNTNTVASITTVSGLLSIVNQDPVAASAASINVVNSGAQTAVLKLSAANAINIANTTYGSIDFYVPGGGTGRVGVEYANNDGSTQTVYTDNTTGLNTFGLNGATSVYQNISFSGTGTKKINSGNLTISGDWSSTGSTDIIDNNTLNPVIYFKGTITQRLYDDGTRSGRGIIFNKVYFQGGGTKTIVGTAATVNGFSVSNTGVLTMDESTTLTVDPLGKLTLISNGTSSATVATIPSGCVIKGNVSVQRFFKAGTVAQNYRNYRLLSSPVNMNATGVTADADASAYTTLSYLNGSPGLFIGGPGGTASGFTVTNATPTIYLYNESLANINTGFNTGNFKGLTNITTNPVNLYNDLGNSPNATATIYAGNGYMLYYTGNNVDNLNNKQNRVGGVYANPDTAVATAVGTLNQGNIPVKLWWSGSTTLSVAKTGYNLVGNPYAATIDWDGVTSNKIIATNVSTKIYIFNYSSKNYGTYQPGLGSSIGSNNATRYIASGQGFFVVAGSGASLTFTESAKTIIQPASLGSSSYLLMGMPAQAEQKPQVLRIKLAKDSINTDESLIAFEPGAKNDYEPILDADRLTGIGNVATLATYATQNTQMLAINHLHSIDSALRVKLYVNVSGVPGINTLTFSGLETLDPRYDVFLIDHYKKDSLQINLYGQYAFNIRADSAASYGDSRFELAFHKKNAINYRLLSFSGAPANNSITLKWKVEAEQNATGFTIEKGDGNGNFTPAYNLQSDGSGTYNWIDKIPATGANTYRLKQNDVFSNISYSKVVSVNFNPPAVSNQVLIAYPNPVKTELNIKINTPSLPAQVLMKVISSAGQIMLSKVSSGNAIQQNVNNLLPGTYIVEVSDNATQKVIGRVKISKP